MFSIQIVSCSLQFIFLHMSWGHVLKWFSGIHVLVLSENWVYQCGIQNRGFCGSVRYTLCSMVTLKLYFISKLFSHLTFFVYTRFISCYFWDILFTVLTGHVFDGSHTLFADLFLNVEVILHLYIWGHNGIENRPNVWTCTEYIKCNKSFENRVG